MPRPLSSSSHHHGLHEQRESAVFRAQQLAAVPSDLLTLKNLVRIDLSMNQLTRFPGEFVATEMLRLEVLLLQGNLLYVFEDILALSIAPRLRELDLRRNPLRLQNNRVYLLEALLSQPGTDDDLLAMARKDDQLRLLSEAGSSGTNKDAALNQRQAAAMSYRAKLPRKNGFPVLMRLNDEWITDREVRDVEAERGRAIEYYQPPVSRVRNSRAGSRGIATSTSTKRERSSKSRSASAAPDPASGRRFDGTRMTIKQMLRLESRSASIPTARVIQRFQIDVDTGNEVGVCEESDGARDVEQPLHWSADADAEPTSRSDKENGTDDGDGGKAEEQMIVRRLFRNASNDIINGAVDGVDAGDDDEDPSEPWNYPISTFDTLGSEDRQYVRAKSKQSGSTLERDDHFFASSIFLDCVAQAERSRRLTVRAVDLLSQQTHTDDQEPEHATRAPMNKSQSIPSLPTCTAAATLVETMNAKFTKQLDRATFEKVRAFQEKQLAVDALSIQAAVGDYYLSEHMMQKQRNSQLLSAAQAAERSLHRQQSDGDRSVAAGAEATIEDSLSKLKLRNAVDLANTLLDPKQQKRVLQQLIDADDKVIDEERVAQEQTAHKLRLELINARRYTPHDAKQIDELVRKANNLSASPWQRRNWRAAKEQQRQQERAERRQSTTNVEPPKQTKSSKKATTSTPDASVETSTSTSVKPLFSGIETVERAAQGSLAGVNSHDLLVRCAEIRQHADTHAAELALYRNQFLEGEAAWERMRQDPTNLVRKHLARRLYQHAQEVQIGSTHIFYSSLFSDA